jgi:hypothetical protein
MLVRGVVVQDEMEMSVRPVVFTARATALLPDHQYGVSVTCY